MKSKPKPSRDLGEAFRIIRRMIEEQTDRDAEFPGAPRRVRVVRQWQEPRRRP